MRRLLLLPLLWAMAAFAANPQYDCTVATRAITGDPFTDGPPIAETACNMYDNGVAVPWAQNVPLVGGACWFSPLQFGNGATHTITLTGLAPGLLESDPSNAIVFDCVAPVKGITLTVITGTAKQVYGATTNLTATVTGASPTGTITFLDNGVPFTWCQNAPMTNGVATCQTSVLKVGTHPVTAVYSGDVNNQPSTSPVFTLKVTPKPPGNPKIQ